MLQVNLHTTTKCLMAYIQQHIPNIEFHQNTTNSEPKRILSNEARMKTMPLKMVEDQVTQATESQLSLLKRLSTILRNISLNFRQSKDTIFKGSITVNNENAPPELEIFFQWLLVRTKDLNTTINDQAKCLAESISHSIQYNMKSECQAQYTPKIYSHVPRKSYQTALQI